MLLEMENEKKEEEDVDYNYKMEDVILPGFRFHPTDEELVGFYLIRKIQQRPLSIELIKQADIYKYDPWDLPKLACNGEKEWYFYCRRDRKYRNSARPNRVVVTGAGFWKATGTDRPIYSSSESVGLGRTKSKCIGLKKSLVFYRGKAAKGIKTDWMMHEFRLPSLSNSMPTPNNLFHAQKNIHIPATNDAWAICKIFKKATTMAQRALCQGQGSDLFNQNIFFSPENISSCTNEITTGASINGCNINYFPDLETPSYQQPIYPNEDLSPCFTWDGTSLLLNKNSEHNNNNNDVFEESMNKYYSMSFPEDIDQEKFWEGEWVKKRHDLVNNNNVGSIRFPFSLAPTEQPDVWKPKLSS